MTLEWLAAEEQRLCTYVDSLTGTAEAQNQQLAEAGVFAGYGRLYEQYLQACRVAPSATVRLEALKRLVFLTWYGTLEPSFLTGIDTLDEEAAFAAYSLPNTYIHNQQLDSELCWMLSYYSSWDYLLLPHAEGRLPALAAFVQAVDSSVLHLPRRQLPPGTMSNRGQLGLYWQSLGVEMAASRAAGE